MDQVTRAVEVIDLSGDRDDQENETDDDATQFESQAADYLRLINMAKYMTPRTLLTQALEIPPTPSLPQEQQQQVEIQQDSGFDTGGSTAENSNNRATDDVSDSVVSVDLLNDNFQTSNPHCINRRRPPAKNTAFSRIRISARMLAPFSQTNNNNKIHNNNNSNDSQALVQAKSHPQQLLPVVPVMYQKMGREIKRLKNMVRKLKSEKNESDEKAKRYLAQSTLTSYGIKCIKNSSTFDSCGAGGGGVSPKLLKSISQQMADTFYTPVIIKKRPKQSSPGTRRKQQRLSSDSSPPEIIPSQPTTVPAISDKTWSLLSFRNSQLSQIF